MRGKTYLKEQLCIKSQKVAVIFYISKKKSAMLFLHQTVVLFCFCSWHCATFRFPGALLQESSSSSSHWFFSVFGSNSLSDRNVPAGDEFVKIHVNSFPVLTQTGVKKKNLSHKDVHVKINGLGNIWTCILLCFLGILLVENHLSG